jgi:hypothetical protein
MPRQENNIALHDNVPPGGGNRLTARGISDRWHEKLGKGWVRLSGEAPETLEAVAENGDHGVLRPTLLPLSARYPSLPALKFFPRTAKEPESGPITPILIVLSGTWPLPQVRKLALAGKAGAPRMVPVLAIRFLRLIAFGRFVLNAACFWIQIYSSWSFTFLACWVAGCRWKRRL